jgi:hypothetical protein
MQEKRLHKRYVVSGVSCKMMFANEVNIMNISQGGVMMAADMVMIPKREYVLNVKYGDTVLSLVGVVVWSVISKDRRATRSSFVPMFYAGLKFKDLQGEKGEELLRLIEEKRVSEC